MFDISFSQNIIGGSVSSPNSEGNFRGAIYAPNGYVYFIPYNARRVLKVNPNTLEILNPNSGDIPGLDFIPLLGQLWVGGTLALNNKIYCPSYTGRINDNGVTRQGVLVIDTETDTLSIIPTLNQLRSSALGENGNVYMAPWAGNDVVRVNVGADNITNMPILWNEDGPSWYPTINGGGGGASAYKRYWGMVPGPGNKIYGVPYGADRIVIVNTDTNLVTQGEDIVNAGYLSESNQIISTIGYQNKWSGGTISPHNNMIYCSPRLAKTILRINTSTDRVDELEVDWPEPIASEHITKSKYFSSILGPDGRIYTVPWNSNIMMIIDPKTNPETITFEDLPISPVYAGGVLTPEGRLLFSPWGTVPRRIMALDLAGKNATFDPNLVLSRWCNNTI
jgi:hypothetical protein